MFPAGGPGRLEVHIKGKSYRGASGARLRVLEEISLALKGGEVAAIVGPSGCGKTTLLRIIVGLDHEFDGTVELPAHGRLGVVFQEPRLLPWRTVEENVRLAAPLASDTALNALFVTLELAEILQLGPEHQQRYFPAHDLDAARGHRQRPAAALQLDELTFDRDELLIQFLGRLL